MSLLAWIIVFSLLGGVLSVIAASVFLLINDKYQKKILPHTVSFAIGALLGAALLALLPHAITVSENVDLHDLGLTILIGLLSFFLLEKMVLWRHCHSTHCEVHSPSEIHTSSEVHSHNEISSHSHSHAHQDNKDASGTLILIQRSFLDGLS